MDVETLIRKAEACLRGGDSPWVKVRSITLSAARFSQLRLLGTDTTAQPNPWAPGVDVIVSPVCDDRVAILAGLSGVLGVFRFEDGSTYWFDQKLMARFSEPNFSFTDKRESCSEPCVTCGIRRCSSYASPHPIDHECAPCYGVRRDDEIRNGKTNGPYGRVRKPQP